MVIVAPPLLGLMRLTELAAKKLGQVLGKVKGETMHDKWLWVSLLEERMTKKISKHTKFVNDAKTNNLLMDGNWRNLFET